MPRNDVFYDKRFLEPKSVVRTHMRMFQDGLLDFSFL